MANPSVEIPQPLSSGATDHPDAAQSGVAQAPPAPEGFGDTPQDAVQAPPVPEGFGDALPVEKPTGAAAHAYGAIKNRLESFIGGMVPQAAIPSLQFVKENVADPLNKFGEDVAAAGEEVGKAPAGALSFFKNPSAYLPSAYGQKPSVESPESAAAREHPALSGIGGGTGRFLGSMASPTNIAIMAAMPEAEAAPIISKALAAGFAIQMSSAAKEKLQNLSDHWGDMTPEQRYEEITDGGLQTAMAAAATIHAGRTLKGEETAPKPKKVKVDKTAPAIKKIAGVEAPVANPLTMVSKEGTLAAKRFQREETIPAASQQLHSAVGQVAEDKIADHEAIMNGERTQDKIAGTQTPSKFDSFDNMAQATRDTAQKTYQKADTISQREQQAWEQQRDEAIEEHKKLVADHNANVDEFNANLAPGETPMQITPFDSTKVPVPDAPMGYNDLKRDLDIARAQSASADAVARDEAFRVGIPKAEKALDNWFKQHDDEITPQEYKSAKGLYSDSERFQELANGLRAGLDRGNLTKNNLINLEATMDNKMIRRGQQPGAFKRLLGDDGYRNWRETANLFAPIEGSPVGGQGWGMYAAKAILAHMVPGGWIGHIGTQWLINKAMLDPNWGNFFRRATTEIKDAAVNGTEQEAKGLPWSFSPKVKGIFDGLIKNERGSAAAPGQIPLTAEDELRHSANGYQALNNRPEIDHTPQKVSERARDIADEYDKLIHDPNDSAVKKSYNALVNDINDQWNYATQEMGIKFEPWTGEGQPYANSKEMVADARDNKHVYFFRGGDIPTDHPLAAVDPQTGLTYNDKFRAVHDLFGHAVGGNQFGPAGEESAWHAHSQMMSPDARPAMTTETRGQNSWVNSGAHLRDEAGNIPAKGEAGYVHPAQRPYAEQKAGILPAWAHGGEAPIEASHWSKTPDLTELNPEHFNENGISPEAKRLAQFPEQSAKATFLGTDKYKEREVQGRPHKYTAKLDPSRYYDIEKDSKGLIEKAQQAAEKNGHYGTAAVMSYLDKEVRDAGYAGHIDPSGVIRSFERVPVTKHSPLNPDGTPNWPANYKPTQLSTEGGAGANYSAADLDKVKQQLGINGSGESAASQEAINRTASEKTQGLKRVVVDTRSGLERPLIGADAVDYQAKPYESVEFRGGDRDGEVIDQGRSARPYTRKGAPVQETTSGGSRTLNLGVPANDTPTGRAALPADEYTTGSRKLRLSNPMMEAPDLGTQARAASESQFGPMERRSTPRAVPSIKDMAASEIATRRPTSTKATLDNSIGQHADAKAMDAADLDSPTGKTAAGKPVMGYKQKMARTLADYAGIKYSEAELKDPQKVINKFTNRVADNLVWLHDQIAPEIREKTKRWYDTAHTLTENIGKQYGFSHEQAAGVTAALSPQNPWDNNIGLAKRMMETYRNKQDHAYTPEMESVAADLKKVPTQSKAFKGLLKDIHGKTLAEVKNADPDVQAAQKALWIRVYDEAHGNPENDLYSPDGTVKGVSTDPRSWIGLDHGAKAIKIMENGSVSDINSVMGQGHKIRNFYNNIIHPDSPNGHVTIDTHATAAGHLRPFGSKDLETAHTFGNSLTGTPGPPRNATTGLQGTYPVYASAYQKAAARLGIKPRELQSITWEAIKSLMGEDKKTPQLKQKAKDIWTDVQNGHLTPAKARANIVNESGGFSKPSWMSDEEWERTGEEGDDTSFEGGK